MQLADLVDSINVAEWVSLKRVCSVCIFIVFLLWCAFTKVCILCEITENAFTYVLF